LPAVTLQRAQFEHALALLGWPTRLDVRVSEPRTVHCASFDSPGLAFALLERRPDISAAETAHGIANPASALQGGRFSDHSVERLGRFGEPRCRDPIQCLEPFCGLSEPSITLPLFEGAGSGQIALRQAAYEEMIATYRQSVLTAFSEVEDNLAAQTLLANQYAAESEALVAARKQLEIVNNQYRDGLITISKWPRPRAPR